MILDFNEHISRTSFVDINNSIYGNNDEMFFNQRGFCRFCNINCSIIDSYHDFYKALGSEFRIDVKLWRCNICGWWELKESERILDENHQNTFNHKLKHGVLRKYDFNDTKLPLNTLREELLKKPDIVYSIHHKKMEQLVASVLSDFYSCEAHVVGKTADNGIDVILVNKDTPILIQVKRRMSAKTEGVEEVRKLLGAVQLQQGKEAILVSSAKKFSRQAIKAANDVVSLDLLKRFDLLDFKSFLSLMNLTQEENKKPWLKFTEWLD